MRQTTPTTGYDADGASYNLVLRQPMVSPSKNSAVGKRNGTPKKRSLYARSPIGRYVTRTRSQTSGDQPTETSKPGFLSHVRSVLESNQREPAAMGNVVNQPTGAIDALKQNFNTMSPSGYSSKRNDLVHAEADRSWDKHAKDTASQDELTAATILAKTREYERIHLFGNLPGEAVPGPETRDMGGRFLVNRTHIYHKSTVFKVAKNMPKGCHLHVHFNSEMPPEDLLLRARKLVPKTMFVRSTQKLVNQKDYTDTEIVFSVLPDDTPTGDIFSESYDPNWRAEGSRSWMLWCDFRDRFPAWVEWNEIVDEEYRLDRRQLDRAEQWAIYKMVISHDVAYGETQTHNGAWACFNQGTRAFKGLLNYEGTYRWYIREAINRMIEDKIMYAEWRPMLMDKTIPSDDGRKLLRLYDQMSIICAEMDQRRDELRSEGKINQFPFGVKIIYCTPRSIPRTRMQTELQDCLELKLQFPHLICGFDLVGAEDRPNNIGFYGDLLVAFQETCKSHNVEIPFMFHAGETLLDTGGSQLSENSNLYDSLLLGACRIGHGYALLKHPLLIEKFKQNDICIEICPTSNELLHLCSNIKEHPYPELLAAGLHCTINSDNSSLFRSSLSYEFYQVMVGSPTMSLHSWRQLVEWSVEHSCLTKAEKEQAMEIFKVDWEAFCSWIVTEYGPTADTLPELK